MLHPSNNEHRGPNAIPLPEHVGQCAKCEAVRHERDIIQCAVCTTEFCKGGPCLPVCDGIGICMGCEGSEKAEQIWNESRAA